MATVIILKIESLVSGRASLLRGTYDADPLQIVVTDPNRLLCPISVMSGGETLLTLNKHDAQAIADGLMQACRMDAQSMKGGA